MSFAPLEAGRFVLCVPEPDDAEPLARALRGAADASPRVYALPAPSAAAIADWIARSRRRMLAGEAFAFAVRHRSDAPPLGFAVLTLGYGAEAGELAYAVAAAADASAARRDTARWMTAFGFETLGLARIRHVTGGRVRMLERAAHRPAGAGRRTVYVAAAALIDARGRVLLAQRPPDKPMAGLWEFPGGKVEPGERPGETLARELAEELGLEIDAAAFEPWDIVCHAYDEFRLLMPLMRCRTWTGAPRPCEGQTLEWVPAARLGELPMPAADRPLVDRLASALAS